MRTASKVALAAAVVVVAGVVAAFGPVVRAAVATRAASMNLTLDVGSVAPGWGALRLGNVTVRAPDVPSLTMVFDRIDVALGADLAVTAVSVTGGAVRLDGDVETVAEELEAWRARRPAARGTGSGTRVEATGVFVEWTRASPEGPLTAWGVRYARDGDGETLGADLVRGARGPLAVELQDAALQLRREAGERQVVKVRSSAATVDVRLGSAPLDLVRNDTPVPPGDAASPGGAGATSRGMRVRDLLARASAALTAAVPDGASVDLDGLHLALRHGEEALNFGPGKLRMAREGARLHAELVPGAAGQKAPLGLRLDVPLTPGPVRFRVEGGPVSLAALGIREGDVGLSDVGRASVEARIDAELSADGSELEFETSGRLRDVTISQGWMAVQPLTDLTLGWRAKGETDPDFRTFAVSEGVLELGAARIEARGDLHRDGEHVRAEITGGVPLASCQAMLDSLPRGLAPLTEGMRLAGTFSLAAHLEFDTRSADRTKVETTVANECVVTAVPPSVDPKRFRAPFVRTVTGADGRAMTLASGPGAAGWIPLGAISRHMETAVLVCEDGRFFQHRGFDEEAVRNSIKENLRLRKFARGASTISMQLTKNLYLAREKTVSRKLQEVLLTMLLEQQLAKREIMELYLNVIEFGPGLYGVGPAAAHYFATTPADLSLGQSLYLASILPRPSVQYFGSGGAVTEAWSNYLRRLMHVARKIRRVDETELADGLSEIVTYGAARSPRRELPPDEDPAPDGEAPDEALLPEPRDAYPPEAAGQGG